MKEEALKIARSASTPKMRKNFLREYLQHVILRKLFELNIHSKLVFHGGTALRIIHNLKRFSEDLDFHLLRIDEPMNFTELGKRLMKELHLHGYNVNIQLKMDKPVQSIFIKFEDLVYETNISSNRTEKINVNIEVDTNPPRGYGIDKSLINRYFPLGFLHHDKNTFLSGKIYAVFQRGYTKGRDFFDLIFLLLRWKGIRPNFNYLNKAFIQTKYVGPNIDEFNWKEVLINKIHSIDWNAVLNDIEPFIEDEADLILMDKEYILSILR